MSFSKQRRTTQSTSKILFWPLFIALSESGSSDYRNVVAILKHEISKISLDRHGGSRMMRKLPWPSRKLICSYPIPKRSTPTP